MLRSNAIHQVDGVREGLHLDEPAVSGKRTLYEITARKFWKLPGDFAPHGVEDLSGGRDEPDPFVTRTVLRLREKVRGGEPRVRGVVGEHEHFAGAGQKVDGDAPEEQALGGHDVRIPRTEHLLDRPQGRGAER